MEEISYGPEGFQVSRKGALKSYVSTLTIIEMAGEPVYSGAVCGSSPRPVLRGGGLSNQSLSLHETTQTKGWIK